LHRIRALVLIDTLAKVADGLEDGVIPGGQRYLWLAMPWQTFARVPLNLDGYQEELPWQTRICAATLAKVADGLEDGIIPGGQRCLWLGVS
jgi:hypothetical protein